MRKLGPKGQCWLKGFHALFACMWVGAAIIPTVKQFFISFGDRGQLYVVLATLDFIDNDISIAGVVGVLLPA